MKISHKSELRLRFSDFNSKICDFSTNSRVKVFRKDYNYKTIVSVLTGHVAGSRAFTRYCTIDIDMKKDLVKILEGKQ